MLPVSLRIISLDAEWDVTLNTAGHVINSERAALIQLGYRLFAGEQSRALLIRVQDKQKLPERLVSLLSDNTFSWTGRQLGGDLNKIGRDFNCVPLIDSMRGRAGGAQIIELGKFASRRRIVATGTATLDKIAYLTLGKVLSKDPLVRLSKWSAAVLLPPQITYAALDVIVGIDVYFHLVSMPDLVRRLPPANATVGCEADVVPSHGSVNILSTRAAVCSTIACSGSWSNTVPGSTPLLYNISTT